MSTSRHLGCDTCKQYIWIGQGGYIYTAEEYLDILREFLLVDHTIGHKLVSFDEHDDVRMDYAQVYAKLGTARHSPEFKLQLKVAELEALVVVLRQQQEMLLAKCGDVIRRNVRGRDE